MGAATEGCINGIPSVGLSVLTHSKDADFTLSKKYAKKIVENVILNGLPVGICLNVNFPVINVNEVKGIKICRQAKGVWKEEFDKRVDPYKCEYYWLTGNFNNFEPNAEDTDEWALKNKYISVVPILVDFTSYSAIEGLKKWKF
jgi:5'-nucleotidase